MSKKEYSNDVFKNAGYSQEFHSKPSYAMRDYSGISKDKLIAEVQNVLRNNLEVQSEKLKEAQ